MCEVRRHTEAHEGIKVSLCAQQGEMLTAGHPKQDDLAVYGLYWPPGHP